MGNRTGRAERRSDALSKDRIVRVATEILDSEGETALTFRTLATRLSTGPGAIYWHVSNKDELLTAATDRIIATAITPKADGTPAQDAIRTIALGVFDAIDTHPWLGTQLAREPWQLAALRILEGFGGQLEALNVPDTAQFDCASALLNYVLGLAGQHAAAARRLSGTTDRTQFLRTVADSWEKLDRSAYPFMRRAAGQLPEHDDRKQFLAGIELILAGITTLQERS